MVRGDSAVRRRTAMAAAPPAAPRDGPLANPSSSSPSPSILLPAASNPAFNIKVPDKLHEPIPEHLLHHGVGRVADSGTDGVGCQDGVDGGNPQMGVGGGGGKRQRCKNPVAERKLDGSSLVPNTTKMQVGEGELHSEKRHPDYRNEPPNPRLKKSKNNKMALNPLVDQRARTLRATPIKGSKEIHHTFAFVQYHVQFYGQTLGLKRAGPGGFSFDVEFEDHQQAWDAYRKCEIPGMSLDWAQINAMDKMAPVPAVASFRPPRFDYPRGSKEPSLPVPWNNPFCTEWDEPPEPIVSDPSKSTRPRRITTNPRHLSSVLRLPADPRQPSKIRYWPLFPRQRR